ncbi:nuclear transport factor 2 family protein [Parahaliea mediterranea]|uniref:Nuclear transport factor 2 family protein n=1 Tax=Parahaliea mediterranea TaxID=651086 RepID=A0A939IL46_9GAMM|nr:nuclear transport factor 2 family protein [Parahaliea mediterranea]MBN7795603.1 nuclear transport factor 2 family protein [Parahaliea mediterranea]
MPSRHYDPSAIEDIKILKARYFRYLDTKQWDKFADLFTADAVGVWDGFEEGGSRFEGGALIADTIRRKCADALTVHHGHMPEIQLTGATSARGVWAMYDYVKMPEVTFEGHGHYHEDYVLTNDGWKIHRLRLTRLSQTIIEGSGASMLEK